MSQVLTGHGSFGKYLHQIAWRETTPACHECGAPVDWARHTLERSPERSRCPRALCKRRRSAEAGQPSGRHGCMRKRSRGAPLRP
ncbi:unnamed protein product [Euphydryas editha]|uniref:Uncharacterized protein n=1 Tax=Euphydryas editha TaxID=104508 RepID=A0AAU9TRE2_EUPED|nr:unnamed protein product [Euphydryas editha]